METKTNGNIDNRAGDENRTEIKQQPVKRLRNEQQNEKAIRESIKYKAKASTVDCREMQSNKANKQKTSQVQPT